MNENEQQSITLAQPETTAEEIPQAESTPTKKAKKERTPKQIRRRQVIFSTSFTVFFVLLGAAGGYVLYRWLNPEKAVLSGSTTEGVVPTEAEVTKGLSGGTLLTDYQPYQLLNYALHKQAAYPYALTLGRGSATAAGVTQNILSATYSTPDVIYNQNVSSSSIVHTANRFYDYLDGTVHSYHGSTEEDLPTATEVPYTYDDFMQINGKLFQGSYYCTATTDSSEVDDAHPVADRYLSHNKEDYDASEDKTKHHVTGVVIYMIGPRTVKSESIEQNEEGYKIHVELYTDEDKANNTDTTKKINTGTSYYSVQMRTTGGLASRPQFSHSELTFQVDADLNLIASEFKDTYHANVGPISATTNQTLYQYYYHSDTNTFSGIEVNVPQIEDTTFDGFNLLPSEDSEL